MRNDTKYAIINASEVDLIDFSQVLQTNVNSLRFSVDRSKTFIKYKGDQPEFIFEITKDLIGRKEYSHPEFLELLKGEEWIPKNIS